MVFSNVKQGDLFALVKYQLLTFFKRNFLTNEINLSHLILMPTCENQRWFLVLFRKQLKTLECWFWRSRSPS